MEDYLKYLEQNLPILCKVRDLVQMKIYASAQGASYARKTGDAPPFMYISGNGIVYPRETLLQWLRKRYVTTNS